MNNRMYVRLCEIRDKTTKEKKNRPILECYLDKLQCAKRVQVSVRDYLFMPIGNKRKTNKMNLTNKTKITTNMFVVCKL